MESSKQLGGIDFFKIVAALLVVAIHTSPLSSFNDNADFILTRIIARVAVPFFLMVTGHFLFPRYLFDRSADNRPLLRFIKKTLFLYVVAIVIYLPVNIYAGQLSGIEMLDFLRMLLFDGTLYHLWYLPASVLGVLLVYFISRKLPFKAVVGIAILLYSFGLLGDSYFGFIANCPAIGAVYSTLFHVFSYTRNGIFYTPIFLVMGAWIGHSRQHKRPASITVGFAVSIALLITEGLILHRLGVQRHDSMYIMLLPCMLFLYQMVVFSKCKSAKCLRTISTWIYLIHPLFIIIVRYAAKVIHLETILIDNSLIHYLAVCILSCGFSLGLAKLLARRHNQDFHKGRAWIELNQKNLRQNVKTLRSLLPPDCQLMPAVKANAYGHGAVLLSKLLNTLGVKSFCVATVMEAVELRRGGIKGDILILGYTHPEQFPLLRKYHLMQTVVDSEYAQVLNVYGKKIKVHLKIDTGMHRLGERCERIDEISRMFQCENLLIEGAYTHLCADDTTSPEDMAVTMAQGKAFHEVISQLKERGCSCPKTHLQASYGLLNYPDLSGDYARIGIALYGVLSTRTDMETCTTELFPVLSIKARVALVKDLYKGEAAGYGLQYVADQDRKIATLTIGYADGLPRSLSCGNGSVLINGNRAPIIGRICMDQTLVDVTDIPNVKQGDIAVIVGKSGKFEITAYDIAEQAETITNELLSRLGCRLNRIIL